MTGTSNIIEIIYLLFKRKLVYNAYIEGIYEPYHIKIKKVDFKEDMKVGGVLTHIEDYLFWRLAHFFVSKQEYRILQMSKDQKELWLEKTENKKFPIIRLLRYDLDWSNWMQQDIERTSHNGESIRKQIRGELNILNLYVSSYLPVDDYEFRIREPYIHPISKKTFVKTAIIESGNYESQIQSLQEIFQDKMDLSLFPIQEDISIEAEKLKQLTLSTAVNRRKQEKSLFESGKPFFTYVFIAIQVAMFLILEISGGSTNSNTLIQYGAKFNPLILEGEWWRFITPVVLHIGFLHLLTNTLSLYFIGVFVERIFGRSRFIFIYLVAGISGSIASFIFSPHLSAGASGAIFGCFGALLYFGLIHPKIFLRTMGANVFVIIAINLGLGFTVPGIDNAGHIGGLIGGFLATGIVHFPKKKKLGLQLLFLIVTLASTGSLIHYGFENPTAVLDEHSILVMSQEYIQEGDFEKAYSLLTNIRNEDLSADYYFLLSYTEIQLENIQDAEKSLKKVIEIDPNYHEAYFNLALVYLEQQRIKEAKLYLEKAVEIEPNQAEYVKLLNEVSNM